MLSIAVADLISLLLSDFLYGFEIQNEDFGLLYGSIFSIKDQPDYT